MKQQEEAEPVPEQTEECMLTEIRSDVLQKFRRERGSREDRIREGSRPIETEECRRVLRRYQGRNSQLSKEAQKNRQKATAMNWGFVAFLAVVCVAILFCSVKYLRYKSEITAKMSTVASLEEELADLKEDNDAYYSQVTSNVDLNKIKQTALGRLGMKYPSDDQTVTYSTSGNSYVRQYQDIPDSK